MKACILIHPNELSRKWIDRMADSGINTLGIHPEGGGNSITSLEGLVKQMESEKFRSLIDYARERGLEVEYELHAFGYLLPRNLFETHPEYFRMNEQGERTPNLNLCPSSAEALDVVAQNALTLAKSLYGSAHRYFFWSDDARGGVCSCPRCKTMSPSDQQLTVLCSIIRRLREEIPDATLAYLAYYSTLDAPVSVKCEDGIFLELAPIDKWHVRVGRHTDECIRGEEREREASEKLLSFFGAKGSRVLEYWIDNSLFSEWKKPPRKLVCDGAETYTDIMAYLDAGYEDISTFGCFLGDDYEELYGEPDVSAYTSAIRRAKNKNFANKIT